MKIILGIIIATLLMLWGNIVLWRMYLRTHLKGYFLIAVGISICTIGIIGIIISKEDLFSHVVSIGRILAYIGLVVLGTLERMFTPLSLGKLLI